MPPLNMMFSRSSTLLKLTCYKFGEVKHFLSRSVSHSSKFFTNSTVDEVGKKISENDLKEKSHILKSNVIDMNSKVTTVRLEGDVPIKTNETVESSDSIVNIENKLEQSYDSGLLERKIGELDDSLMDLDEKLPGPFDPCNEDLSHIGPSITPTYNFAKFADDSHTIQQLVKLGVELYKLERYRNVVEMFLSLDFDRDMKPYIQFLHDCGVSPDDLGPYITRNPMIFKEDMDDLRTRIRYLRAHNFIPKMIKTILIKHPPWLSFKTQEIDRRLGYFQNTFTLNGYQVRCLTIKCPKLICYDMMKVMKSTFAVKEEMGFNIEEAQEIILKEPRVMIRARSKVVDTFDYVHNVMELSHAIISQQPQILVCRKSRVETRHRFLVELKRNQYDPTKPLYVSPHDLVNGNDIEFCKNIAKASIHTYNQFLMTV